MESENTKQHPTTCINIEQKRAAYALKEVRQHTERLGKDEKEEWERRANELPAMIQMNGIGAAVAFYKTKDSGAHRGLLNILQNWLCGKQGFYPQKKSLINALVNGDMYTYRAAQAEAQALLIWVKKFSKIKCHNDNGDKS